MGLPKRACLLIFLSAFVACVGVLVHSLSAIGRTGWALDITTYPFFLSAVCGLSWGVSSIWSVCIVYPEEEPERVSILPGLMAVFSSLGLTYLRLPSRASSLVAFTLTAVTIAVLYGRVTATIVNTLSGACHAAILALHGEADLAEAVLLIDLLTVVATLSIGRMLAEWRKSTDMFEQARWAASEFAAANVRLQNSMNVNEIVTRESERERVAREIHDTVGYALTAILVQVNVIRKLLPANLSESEGRLDVVADMIRRAIQDVRKEVSKLRSDEPAQESWRTRWLRLCETFAHCTGVRIPVSIAADMEPIDDPKGEIIYRTIQEALTNAYRHGSATVVDVVVGWEEQENRIYLRISDNGSGCARPRAGNGLSGICERVRSVGGQVAWETKLRAGFDLGIVIPWGGE